ncbi:MAG: hypothetical protein EA351_01165 [Gemmatimonadales bacterium]|nr:MAG: hypothetical protein EA351_01165 [Gemmatimonadales bacterium]
MMKRSSAYAMRVWLRAPLLLFIGVAGCTEGATPALDPVVRDSAGVMIAEFPAGALEWPAPLGLAENPEVRIGVVDGASEYQWTRPVAAARLSDGSFAVLEQAPAEVRVFDSSGGFLGRMGAGGDGPGEFRSPVGLAALPGDTILVWDRGSTRLSWFGVDGTLAREQTLREPGGIRSLRRVALSPSGAVVVLGATTTEEDLGNQGRIRETWQVVPLAPGSSALGTVPGTERAIQIARSDAGEVMSVNVQGRWWWGEGFAWASARGVWTADQLSLEARHFDLDQGLDRIIRIMAPDRPFTRALIDSLHRVELDRVDDPRIRELWRADFEDREYPQGMPPVAAVFADAAERVWIGLTEPPPERLPSGELTAVRRWVVFEEGAGTLELRGVLTLPPRSHPLWADAEGVLLVRSDADLDVAYVEWYRYVGG